MCDVSAYITSLDVQVYKMARSVFKELVQEKIGLNDRCNDVGYTLGQKVDAELCNGCVVFALER